MLKGTQPASSVPPQRERLRTGSITKDSGCNFTAAVSNYMEKDAAEKAAKRVYGVRAVANNI